MQVHEYYMTRCIELALKGLGEVAPNPMVGAVLVYQDKVIGEGYHEQFGEAHAEVNCFKSVMEKDEVFVSNSILYVSLEPCAHFGKTPPCVDLIIYKGVKKVVIGCRDPFEAVNGKGIEKLQNAGVEVIIGILENECINLNERFFTYHQKHRPYIILKWTETVDGKIAGLGNERLMISNAISTTKVHQWRSEEMAILVGTNTVLKDNPSLDNRLWAGKSPIRMLIDQSLKLPNYLKVFTDNKPTIVFNFKKEVQIGTVQYIKILPNKSVLLQIMDYCYVNKINSILVEGGAQLLQSFINENIWDEARIIVNTTLAIGNGLDAPKLKLALFCKEETILNDQISYYKKANN